MSFTTTTASTISWGYLTLRLPEFDLEGYLTCNRSRRLLELTDHDGMAEVLNVDLRDEGFVTFPDEVIVRDWWEHAGLAGALVDAGVAMRTESLTVGPFFSRAYRLQLLTSVVAH